ncbi:hypothetical protein [Bacillus sp. MMSF_3328]
MLGLVLLFLCSGIGQKRKHGKKSYN